MCQGEIRVVRRVVLYPFSPTPAQVADVPIEPDRIGAVDRAPVFGQLEMDHFRVGRPRGAPPGLVQAEAEIDIAEHAGEVLLGESAQLVEQLPADGHGGPTHRGRGAGSA